MDKLQLMTEWELEQIFGPVDKLIPIHEGIKKKPHPQIIGRTYHKELRYKIKDRHSRNRKIFLPHSTWFIYSCFVSVCWKLIFDHLSELASGLQNQRLPDGTTRDIGSLLVDWVSII